MDELFTHYNNTDFFVLFVEYSHFCDCEQGDAMANKNKSKRRQKI